MKRSVQEYEKMIEKASPSSPGLKNCAAALLCGGPICAFGQLLHSLWLPLFSSEENARAAVSVTLIFLAVLLTALGVFDRLAKRAGAGTLVPITGFANAVASPAIEFKSEGFVLGVGAKMFVIAGPVIVYGTASAMIYGLLYYFALRLLGA